MGQLEASKNDRDPAMTEFERAHRYTDSINSFKIQPVFDQLDFFKRLTI